jgi:hypothetical protein
MDLAQAFDGVPPPVLMNLAGALLITGSVPLSALLARLALARFFRVMAIDSRRRTLNRRSPP